MKEIIAFPDKQSFNPPICPLNTPLILLLVSAAGLMIGLFVFFRPELTIEIQRKFYEKINWRMEPISMAKEVRNTRIMGMFLAIVSILTIIARFAKYA